MFTSEESPQETSKISFFFQQNGPVALDPGRDQIDQCNAYLSTSVMICKFQTGSEWVKNNSCLFEGLFKVKKNGVFLFEISFFVLEIFSFLYYANEGSDDVIDRSTKTIQHSIKNISSIIKAVFLKLGTRNVHLKRNKMTAVMPWP